MTGPCQQTGTDRNEATMTFTAAETGYLKTQLLGRLATIQPDGTPQVNPVGFRYNEDLGTIDIGGYHMSASQKFRNVTGNSRVAFVVDDIVSRQPWRVRCLEIRGAAEAVGGAAGAAAGTDDAIIRIYPRRIISFGIDEPDREPHLLTPSKRNVT
jgi:pyridoxamine 5'-phosphate oxidase family protein